MKTSSQSTLSPEVTAQLRANGIEAGKLNCYSAALQSGQHASRSLFLISAGGCVAILSYLASSTISEEADKVMKHALMFLTIGALTSALQTAAVYLQLLHDYKGYSSMFDEHYNMDSEKNIARQRKGKWLSHLAIGLWIFAFCLTCWAAYIVFSFFSL